MVICPKGIFISCELPDINDHLHVSMSISKMYDFKKYFYPKPAYVKRKLISPLLIFSLSAFTSVDKIFILPWKYI